MAVSNGQPTPVGILADDLTGSLDAGLQLHVRGIATEVSLPHSGAVRYGNAGAVVVDTESRDLPAPEARKHPPWPKQGKAPKPRKHPPWPKQEKPPKSRKHPPWPKQ